MSNWSLYPAIRYVDIANYDLCGLASFNGISVQFNATNDIVAFGNGAAQNNTGTSVVAIGSNAAFSNANAAFSAAASVRYAENFFICHIRPLTKF